MAQTEKKIQLFFIPFELGAGTRGASLGPYSVRIAGFDAFSDFFSKHAVTEIYHDNHELFLPVKFSYAKRLEAILDFGKTVTKSIAQSVSKKNVPFVLSGDHTSAVAICSGIREAKKKSRIGIIWIDAHADLHSPFTTPSGNVHGMSLAAILNKDNAKRKIRSVQPDVKQLWEQYKNLHSSTIAINPNDVILVSLRDMEQQEKELIKEEKVNVITTTEMRNKGVEYTIRKIFSQLQYCNDIYISFDVDCLDPSVSKGTGTPSAQGLRVKEAEELVAKLMQHEKICCFEICEMNPTLDTENTMSEIVFSILQKAAMSLLMN